MTLPCVSEQDANHECAPHMDCHEDYPFTADFTTKNEVVLGPQCRNHLSNEKSYMEIICGNHEFPQIRSVVKVYCMADVFQQETETCGNPHVD